MRAPPNRSHYEESQERGLRLRRSQLDKERSFRNVDLAGRWSLQPIIATNQIGRSVAPAVIGQASLTMKFAGPVIQESHPHSQNETCFATPGQSCRRAANARSLFDGQTACSAHSARASKHRSLQ